MRFATFVAFMLPLAALAVPTPIPRQFNTTFTDAINRLNTAAEDASSSISVMLYDLGASQNSQEQTFYDGLQVASLNSQIAVKAVISIYDTVKSNNTFLDTDRFYLVSATKSGQITLTSLNETLSQEDFIQNVNTNLDLNKLQSNIFSALDGMDRMVQASNDLVGEAPSG